MAYDAGMLAACIAEIKDVARGARIEKVCQPEREEIVLQMRSFAGGKRLLINAGSHNPRMGFTEAARENPAAAPMFCMLLRKYLSGAKLTDVRQEGFERVARLEFETRDEMGFACRRFLVAEIMGKYSNLVFTDEQDKILAVLRPVDFSTSSRRQVLPGMRYELPPSQDKANPLETDRDAFLAALGTAPGEKPVEKWILAAYCGISASVAREMAFLAAGNCDVTVEKVPRERLADVFFNVTERIRSGRFAPVLYTDGERPVEYAFLPLTQYGNALTAHPAGAGAVLDAFFANRDRENRVKQRAADVLHILTNAETRLHKKLDLQRGELAACEHGAEYKRAGDLITANLYRLSRGMTKAELTDYGDYHEEDGSYGICTVTLDSRLTPAANAQTYYKKYTKSKSAKEELTRQIALGETELTYIYSVFDALTHAETEADLAEVREELYRSGYASRMKDYKSRRQPAVPAVAKFRTSNGMTVLCGKNNMQNEYITHKVAEKNDYWFHAKNVPGSHTVLLCNGKEPADGDLTEAAEIAAHFSGAAGGQNIPVDYTLARNVKKPAGGKPGLVIYHTNRTAYVTPDSARIERMREGKKTN